MSRYIRFSVPKYRDRRRGRRRSRQSLSPLRRVARRVEYGVDGYDLVSVFVKDGVGEPTYERTATALVNASILFWRSTDNLHTRIDAAQEFCTKPCPMALVSRAGVRDFALCFRGTNHLNGHSDCESDASLRPRSTWAPTCSRGSPCDARVPAPANRAMVHSRGLPPDHPTSPQQAATSRRDLDQIPMWNS